MGDDTVGALHIFGADHSRRDRGCARADGRKQHHCRHGNLHTEADSSQRRSTEVSDEIGIHEPHEHAQQHLTR